MNSLKHVSCNFCGGSNTKLLYASTVGDTPPTAEDYVGTHPGYGKYHDLVQCQNCSLIYMNPRDAEIPRLLSEVVDHDYIDSQNERIEMFQNHLKLIKRFKPQGSLLDIGCYAGTFLSLAKQAGYRVEGVEPSVWAANYAKEQTGAEVHCESIEKMALPENSFDIVTLWDVVEHLEDPLLCLKKAYRAMKPDGILIISTHNIGSLFARSLGSHYPWLMRFHLYHFTPDTLAMLGAKAGFSRVMTESYKKRFSLAYFLQRIHFPWRSKFFERIRIQINMGDMFLLVLKKNGFSS
jgi:2-polyprenyl-3-methyl-5-hydroxy-6-metoxy-1,4-benzoquinol methylase